MSGSSKTIRMKLRRAEKTPQNFKIGRRLAHFTWLLVFGTKQTFSTQLPRLQNSAWATSFSLLSSHQFQARLKAFMAGDAALNFCHMCILFTCFLQNFVNKCKYMLHNNNKNKSINILKNIHKTLKNHMNPDDYPHFKRQTWLTLAIANAPPQLSKTKEPLCPCWSSSKTQGNRISCSHQDKLPTKKSKNSCKSAAKAHKHWECQRLLRCRCKQRDWLSANISKLPLH